MRPRNRGFLTALLLYWAIFNNLDPGMANNPVFRIKPKPQGKGTADALISYKSSNRTSYSTLTVSLDTFTKDYRVFGLVPGRGQNVANCDYDLLPPPGKVCNVDIQHCRYPCDSYNIFSYHRASPCVFLALDTAWYLPTSEAATVSFFCQVARCVDVCPEDQC